jgi:hypothetical protein
MKKIFALLIILGLIGSFSSCEKCYDESTPACAMSIDEKPDELCEALWTSWFYDKDKGTCKEYTYGGCQMYGFATKAECKECKCD